MTVLAFVALQLQLIMQGNRQAQNYDTRAYEVCAPWLGERGDKLFRPAFLNGLGNFADDYNTLEEHAMNSRG